MNNNNMLYGDVFDKIEDLLDFSDEEMQMLMEVEPAATTTVDVPPTALPGLFLDDDSSAPPTNDTDHFLPCDHDSVDAAELEWLSNFVEESFSHRRSCTTSTIPPPHTTNHQVVVDPSTLIMKKVQYRRRTQSPISVLLGHGGEGGQQSSTTFSSTSSSSSPTSSSCCSSISKPLPIRAPRTKRTRPSTSLSKDDDSLLLLIPNFAESNPILQPHNNNNKNITSSSPTNTKFKKLKIISSASASAVAAPPPPPPVSTTVPDPVPVPVRKCMHCEIQKTPQWRAGPMGPKTLCNACGVRYKSGRLFPEYRPAASPTFVASHHSNSHKKVIEMRVKSTQEKEKEVLPPALPVSVKACELFNYINTN